MRILPKEKRKRLRELAAAFLEIIMLSESGRPHQLYAHMLCYAYSIFASVKTRGLKLNVPLTVWLQKESRV